MWLFSTLEPYMTKVVESWYGAAPIEKQVSAERNSLVQQLAKKMGIVSPVSAYETQNVSHVKSRTAIYLNPNDPDFVIAHELAHIKFNDIRTQYIVAGSLYCLSLLGMWAFKSVAAEVAILATGTAFAVNSAHHRYQEKRADLEAWNHSSPDEREQFIQYLKKKQRTCKALYEKLNAKSSSLENLVGNLVYSSEGEARWLFSTHPSYSTRIAYLTSHRG